MAKHTYVHTPLRARRSGQVENSTVTVAASAMAVRRLTPVECERLQGFPDGHTEIPVAKRKRLEADELAYIRQRMPGISEDEARHLSADGPRYKAIGNSMAVPVMRWIGQRIAQHTAANTNCAPVNQEVAV